MLQPPAYRHRQQCNSAGAQPWPFCWRASGASFLARTLGLAGLAAGVLQHLEISGALGLLALLERVPGVGAVHLLHDGAAAAVAVRDVLWGVGWGGVGVGVQLPGEKQVHAAAQAGAGGRRTHLADGADDAGAAQLEHLELHRLGGRAVRGLGGGVGGWRRAAGCFSMCMVCNWLRRRRADTLHSTQAAGWVGGGVGGNYWHGRQRVTQHGSHSRRQKYGRSPRREPALRGRA